MAIPTPFRFEPGFSDQEFQKLGQFAARWANIEHTIGNSLRVLLELTPKQANALVFPLGLDQRMQRIERLRAFFSERSQAVFAELKPLVAAMQYIRNTAIHGIVVDLENGEEPYFDNRAKGHKFTKSTLIGCEDLINYTAHVTIAFRLSIGDKDDWPEGQDYALPDRPPIPAFLPENCQKFPAEDTVMRRSQL